MATNKKRTSKVNRREADARVLGQILAAQNIEFVLPDIVHIAEFYAETMMAIPGVAACRICLEDVTIQRGEMQSMVCDECHAWQENAAGQKEFSTSGGHFECGLANQPGIQLNSITTLQHHFGFFVFRVGEPDVFDVYKPFIGNLANYVAFSLENRLQKDWLQKAHDELERRVEERTRALAATNTHLQKEIENRRQVEEALRASEERYHTLFEHAPDAIFLENDADEIVDVNPAACALLGYSREELLGLHVIDLQAPEIRGQAGNIVRGELLRYEGSPFESVDLRRDGTRVAVEISNSRMGDSNLALSIVRDITERKLAEAKIEQHLNELERWYDVTLNREERVQELKREVNQLLARLGEAARYTNQG